MDGEKIGKHSKQSIESEQSWKEKGEERGRRRR